MRARAPGLAAITCLVVVALAACGTNDDSAASAAADAPRSFFGIVPQTQLTSDDFARMQQGGIGGLRIMLAWSVADPTPQGGDYTFADSDQMVLGAAQAGIDVVPFLYGSPTWVTHGLDGVQCDVGCETYAPRSAEALDAWGKFVAAAVERYGPHGTLWDEHPDVTPRPIRTWQIWNEQNSPTFYQPRPDPDQYAKLVDVAAEQIRKRDPDAQVILGGMFGTPFEGEHGAYTAWQFLRRLYEIEGPDGSFDGIAAHPYAAHIAKIESQAKLMHDEVERAGDDDATFWVTEVGAGSATGGNPLNRGSDGQAELLTQAYDYLLGKRTSWNIPGVYWYSWRDTETPICDWCTSSGLFPADGFDPKPAWDALTTLTGGS